MNATTVALPNTYHHPVSGGTGCFASELKNAINPVRSSKASINFFSSFQHQRNYPLKRDGTGEDFDFAVANPHWIA